MTEIEANRDRSKNGLRLRISRRTWRRMIRELQLRGGGVRESGAFLLASSLVRSGSKSAPTVQRVVYYDDLDSACLTGGISLAGHGYDILWRICAESRLSVVADVHTHPSHWVDQSEMDAGNPMIAMAGHIALIIPRFAAPPLAVKEVGVHLYEGGHRWQRLKQTSRSPVRITVFADLRWWHTSRNAASRLASWPWANARRIHQRRQR